MYDYNYFKTMDRIMVEILIDTALVIFQTIAAIAWYLVLQLIRLYYYIADLIEEEKKSQHEETIRFQNLKRNGHI